MSLFVAKVNICKEFKSVLDETKPKHSKSLHSDTATFF